MPNLSHVFGLQSTSMNLSDKEKASVLYHDIFDYPLSMTEMIRWRAGFVCKDCRNISIETNRGCYYRSGRDGLIYKKLLRNRISKKKRLKAVKAASILAVLPTVKMLGLTGSLAMNNSNSDSDIDLMIVVKSGWLWTTRILCHLLLNIFGFSVRKAGDKDQRDKLCLNMWIDENDLIWKTNKRNAYTAHELAQIQPLVNKDMVFEKMIALNLWILKYWPNSVDVRKIKILKNKYLLKIKPVRTPMVEKISFWLQMAYMRNRITRETITSTRAFFHPYDWSNFVRDKFSLEKRNPNF